MSTWRAISAKLGSAKQPKSTNFNFFNQFPLKNQNKKCASLLKTTMVLDLFQDCCRNWAKKRVIVFMVVNKYCKGCNCYYVTQSSNKIKLRVDGRISLIVNVNYKAKRSPPNIQRFKPLFLSPHSLWSSREIQAKMNLEWEIFKLVLE